MGAPPIRMRALERVGLVDFVEDDAPPAPWAARAVWSGGRMPKRWPSVSELEQDCGCGGCGASREAGRSATSYSRSGGGIDDPLGGAEDPAGRARLRMEELEKEVLWKYENADPRFGGRVPGGHGFDFGIPDIVKRFNPGTVTEGEPNYRFSIPAGRDGSCELASSEADCREYAPYINATDTTTACADEDNFQFVAVNSCHARATRMVRRAWCMLIENVDIVQWACCIIFGWWFTADIAVKLFGINGQVEVTCSDGDPALAVEPCPGSLARSWWDVFGGFTNLCTTHVTVARQINLFATGTEADKLCAIIDFASLLVHELTHIVFALLAADGDEHRGDCEQSYMFGNTVRWALLKRYSSARDSECCASQFYDEFGEVDDRTFSLDDSEFLTCSP